MGNKSLKKEEQKDNKEKKIDVQIEEEEKKDTKNQEEISKYIKDESEESNEDIYYKIKDIETEYSKLENEIQQLSLDKNCDDNENENEVQENSHENYLKKLRNIYLLAQKIANEIKKALFEEFKERKTQFVNLKLDKKNNVDLGCINEFSSWCKNNIKSEELMVEDLCKKSKEENYNEEDLNIFIKLTKIYLQCGLCNEIIELKTCNNNDNFDKNQMYDLAEIRGINKKVKFLVLPGLFYNGNYLQNGKIHIYAYSIKNKK